MIGAVKNKVATILKNVFSRLKSNSKKLTTKAAVAKATPTA